MIAICNKNYFNFKKGEKYKIEGIYSIFEKNDFISLNNDSHIYRFRLNKSSDYIDDYIGTNEAYFYDYFIMLKDERKTKLEKIEKKNKMNTPIKLANVFFYYDEEDNIWYDEKFKYRFYKTNYCYYKLYYGGFDNLIYKAKTIDNISIGILKHNRKLKLNEIK